MPSFLRSISRQSAKAHLRRRGSSEHAPTVRAVPLGDLVSRRIVLDKFYEGRELDALAREVFPKLPRDSTALDIGAHMGNHTVSLRGTSAGTSPSSRTPSVACAMLAGDRQLEDSLRHAAKAKDGQRS